MYKRGFWADILISPFISFGVESEEKSLFKTENDEHVKVSTNSCSLIFQMSQDVCVFNIQQMFQDFEQAQKSGKIGINI